jgi:ribonuclease P protein component
MAEKSLPAEEQGAEKNLPYQTRRDLNSLGAAFDVERHSGFTLGKAERLKSSVLIDKLFKEGKAVKLHGFTLLYLYHPLPVIFPAQAAFTVSKRNFRNANERNRIKRLLREAYRTMKPDFYQRIAGQNKQLALCIIYNGREIPALADVKRNPEA